MLLILKLVSFIYMEIYNHLYLCACVWLYIYIYTHIYFVKHIIPSCGRSLSQMSSTEIRNPTTDSEHFLNI